MVHKANVEDLSNHIAKSSMWFWDAFFSQTQSHKYNFTAKALTKMPQKHQTKHHKNTNQNTTKIPSNLRGL